MNKLLKDYDNTKRIIIELEYTNNEQIFFYYDRLQIIINDIEQTITKD